MLFINLAGPTTDIALGVYLLIVDLTVKSVLRIPTSTACMLNYENINRLGSLAFGNRTAEAGPRPSRTGRIENHDYLLLSLKGKASIRKIFHPN